MKARVTTLLSLKNLKTYYYVADGSPIKAVDGVTFDVNEGEIVGMVGESGSGKSTIGFSVLQLLRPPGRIVDGKIIYKKKNLLELDEKEMRKIRGKEIAMIFQDPTTFLNPVMKIEDQICETIIKNENCIKELAKEKCAEVLKKVRLYPELMNRYPFELSCGMQQRVVLALALSCSPSLLIMDEPTTALDVTIQAQILKLIQTIREEFNTSMILITHDLGIVAELCDRINVIYVGKLVEQADVLSLYENPMHPYTQGLLRSVLSIDEFKEELVAIEGSVPNPVNLPRGCVFHPRCPEVMPICKRKAPPLVEPKNNHTVSCWLYS
jgi:oligopeptide/dipeptide ABC transporter ATP-binding protein